MESVLLHILAEEELVRSILSTYHKKQPRKSKDNIEQPTPEKGVVMSKLTLARVS